MTLETRIPMTTCDVCGIGRRETRRVRRLYDLGERIAVVENVPATVCSHCGETTFDPDTSDRVFKLVHGDGLPVRKLEANVYEFA